MGKAIAVFDIDGTVLEGSSAERTFAHFLLTRGEIRPANVLRFTWRFLTSLARDPARAMLGNRIYLAGRSVRRIEDLAGECFRDSIEPRIYGAAREAIGRHRADDHEIVLLSGTLDFLLRRFHDDLGADHAHGTRLEVRDGRFTGEIVGAYPFGSEKARIVHRHFGDGYDLARSWAYADTRSDFELLGMFGHPVVVNPSARLAARARQRGFETVLFREGTEPRRGD